MFVANLSYRNRDTAHIIFIHTPLPDTYKYNNSLPLPVELISPVTTSMKVQTCQSIYCIHERFIFFRIAAELIQGSLHEIASLEEKLP